MNERKRMNEFKSFVLAGKYLKQVIKTKKIIIHEWSITLVLYHKLKTSTYMVILIAVIAARLARFACRFSGNRLMQRTRLRRTHLGDGGAF